MFLKLVIEKKKGRREEERENEDIKESKKGREGGRKGRKEEGEEEGICFTWSKTIITYNYLLVLSIDPG